MDEFRKINRINWPVLKHIAEGPRREHDALQRWRNQPGLIIHYEWPMRETIFKLLARGN